MKYKYIVTSDKQKEYSQYLGSYQIIQKKINEILKSEVCPEETGLTEQWRNLYVQKHGQAPRIIWQKKEEGDTCVVVLIKLYRSHDDYKKYFLSMKSDKQKQDWLDQNTSFTFNNTEIEEIFKELEQPEEEESPILLNELTDAENEFIHDLSSSKDSIFDTTIYETKQWMNKVQAPGFDDFDAVAEPLEEAITLYEGEEEYGEHLIPLKHKNGQQNIYAIHCPQESGGKGSRWILLDIVNQNEVKIDGEQEKDYESLIKDCRRTYPYTSLDDKDFWRKMEGDPNSNFVLSDEESRIIQRNNDFPFFISGRAGSGKSTVLQYMFADILLRYYEHKKNDELKPPLYLSYSNQLVQAAMVLSESLLDKNHLYQKKLKKLNINYSTNIKPEVTNFFAEFKEIIKKCIKEKNPNIIETKFSLNKYVSYSDFRNAWTKRFGKNPDAIKKYSPSICWHIIRTYIKGWDSSKFLTPEGYSKIGRSNQDVSEQTYKDVYEEVWDKWYKNADSWDDQDLVRYCLHPNDESVSSYVEEKYSAIFCDEAQDFTRAEIDFILSLSSFSNRKYYDVNELSLLPFVFAGDEFQTLNPTGFNWDSVKSYFSNKLSQRLNFKPDEISLNDPVPLTKNYRSTSNIVKLGNRIQLLRESRFNQQSEPQDPYFSDEGHSIYCIDPNNVEIWKRILEMGVVLIVPSSDGQSVQEYINTTSIRNFIEFDEEGTPKKIRILNPTQAKGLEFPNVCVYGFDCSDLYQGLSLDSLESYFYNSQNGSRSDIQRNQEDIELKYQINNAYVSVTRAKERLFILDEFNVNSFWSFAFSSADPALQSEINKLEDLMLKGLSNKRKEFWSKDKLGWITRGNALQVNLNKEINHQNILSTSSMLKQRGIERCDSSLLRQAAASYREIGNLAEAYYCQAFAFSFDPNPDYEKAAASFIEAANNFSDPKSEEQSVKKALDNYWEAVNDGAFKETDFIKKIEENENLFDLLKGQRIELVLCDLLVKKYLSLIEINDFFESILSNKEIKGINAWSIMVGAVIKKLKDNDFNEHYCEKFKQNLKQFESKLGTQIDCTYLVKIAHDNEDYQYVIDLCESHDIFPTEYYKAKVKLSKYPDTVRYLKSTGDSTWESKVLSEYQQNKHISINKEIKQIICESALNIVNKETINELLPSLLSYVDFNSGTELLNRAERCGIKLNFNMLSGILSYRYLKMSEWQPLEKSFKDEDAISYELIKILKDLRSNSGVSNFRQQLDRIKIKNIKIKDYLSKQYSKYSNSQLFNLLLLELGLQFENRGVFIDSIRYYEWAANQTADNKVKRELDIRWIVCKEKLGELEHNDSQINDAVNKRVDLKIGPELELPNLPDINKIIDWESLFAKIYKVDSSTEEKSKEKNINHVENKLSKIISGETNIKPASSIASLVSLEQKNNKVFSIERNEYKTIQNSQSQAQNYSITIENFEFYFNGEKKELRIKDVKDEDEPMIRIKNGKFPEEGDYDFFLNENRRMIKSDSKEITPFEITCENSKLIIKIYSGDVYQGINLEFDLKK